MTTSVPEDILYMMLCARFGRGDVIRQYNSYWYPFACDFYIKSRDLYIELNAFWMHGGRWFSDETGSETLAKWRDRLGDGVSRYEDAVRTWTVRDRDKRDQAATSGLNYLVFWRNDLSDALAWFEAGCPDADDYVREYSWMDESEAARWLSDVRYKSLC